MKEQAGYSMRYVMRIPGTLSKGMVLVHNHVRPQPKLGDNGFRAWIETLNDALEVCPCDWAGADLRGLIHYRTKAKP